jgi:hypothetical protein
MSNNKQSSIEWYETQVWNLLIQLENKEITLGQYGVTRVDLFNQAKEMHKVEIKESWKKDRQFVFFDCDTDNLSHETIDELSEQYYNETFNTK